MTPEELTTATFEAIGALGAKYYFHPDTLSVGKELGLDGFRFYVIGRGGVLGNVESPVVTSAFGYFHPAVIDKMWTTSCEIVEPREAARRSLQCNAALGRKHLGDVAGLDAFCEAAEAVCAGVNPAGLALYAGYVAEPLPDDAAARALQLIVTLRELRGSQHLAAIVAAGLHPAVAHALRRPDDLDTFGWADGVEIPDGATDTLAAVDAATDELTAATYRPLSDDQRTALATGVAAITAAFDTP